MQACFAQASLATNILHFFINLIVLLWHKVIEDFISLIALRSLMPVILTWKWLIDKKFLYLRRVNNFRNTVQSLVFCKFSHSMEKLTDVNECQDSIVLCKELRLIIQTILKLAHYCNECSFYYSFILMTLIILYIIPLG